MSTFETPAHKPVFRYGHAYTEFDLVADKTCRVHAYWLGKHAAGKIPTLQDIDLMEIYDLAPFVVIRDVVGRREEYIVRYWGTGMTATLAYDLTGKTLAESYSPEGARQLMDIYDRVIDTRGPVRIIGCLGFTDHKSPRMYEAVHTPLANDDGDVAYLMSCWDFDDTANLPALNPPDSDGGWDLIMNMDTD